MKLFSIEEVIEQAIQTERLGRSFYTSMAARFEKDESFKKLFETLAAKELKHEQTFSELKEILGGQTIEGAEEVSQYLRAIVESAFFLGEKKSLTALETVKTISEAVDYALGFEKETLLYYLGIRNAVMEKEIIDEIINEEQSHIMWLNKFKGSYVKSK